MKKFLAFMGFMAVLVMGANYAFSNETVLLEAKNTVSLREEFTESSVDTVKQHLIALSQTLPAKEPIYLYLNTPGGGVFAGSSLIATIKGIKNPVYVIAEFAASMGYLTTQGTTGKRLVTSNGVLMAHRAYLGVEGQTPGEISTRLNFYEKVTNDLAAMAANRTGITPQAYQDKVRAEYWVYGEQAVKDKQADGVVNVSCSADLQGTSTETLYTIFGPIGIVWDNCPLISSPVAIELPRMYSDSPFSAVDYANFERSVRDMLTKPKLDIINDYQLQSNFHHYVR